VSNIGNQTIYLLWEILVKTKIFVHCHFLSDFLFRKQKVWNHVQGNAMGFKAIPFFLESSILVGIK